MKTTLAIALSVLMALVVEVRPVQADAFDGNLRPYSTLFVVSFSNRMNASELRRFLDDDRIEEGAECVRDRVLDGFERNDPLLQVIGLYGTEQIDNMKERDRRSYNFGTSGAFEEGVRRLHTLRFGSEDKPVVQYLVSEAWTVCSTMEEIEFMRWARE